MKYFIIIILLSLTSCSQKQKSKSSFKMTLGKITASMDGGSYLNAIDKAKAGDNIIKLDAENSASIPYATYDLLLVGFAGPAQNEGPVYCGSVLNTALSVSTASFTVTLTEAECSQPIYKNTVLELRKGIASKWDNDRFDISRWGN